MNNKEIEKMKLSKKFRQKNNRYLVTLTKEKLINKINKPESAILINKKFSNNNTTTKKNLYKNNLMFKEDNNITINNNINNIFNNIIITTNHSLEKNPKYITTNNSKLKQSYQPFVSKRNIRKNFLSLMKEKNISRNGTFINSNNNSFNFIPYNNKIGKQPSFNLNKMNNDNEKIKKINKRNNNFYLTNNKSLHNHSINSSINEIVKRNLNISLNTNNFEHSLRNKFYNIGKDNLKKKETNKKIKNAFLGINKNINPRIILINKNNIKKVKSNFDNQSHKNKNNLTKSNILRRDKNKTLNNLRNNKLKYNNKTINNKNDININNNFQITQYNEFNDYENKTFYKIIIKDEKNGNKIKIEKKRELIESANKKNKKEKIKNNNSSLNDTINFSKSTSTTKIEDEGELGLDDVRDIIIYYNLSKELIKDYLFEKNDYINFLQKKGKKYLRIFVK